MTQEDKDRYLRAAHAMQTGVAYDKRSERDDQKHLRTGINSAMVTHAAVAKLLVEKGVITTDEYEKALADEMEAEVARYQRLLHEQYGGTTKITLA